MRVGDSLSFVLKVFSFGFRWLTSDFRLQSASDITGMPTMLKKLFDHLTFDIQQVSVKNEIILFVIGIVRKFYNISTIVHDFNNFNMKTIVNLKGLGRDIFKDTVFGYLLDVPRLQGDGLLFHKMFLHQIRPDAVLSPDEIKRQYEIGIWPEEFCLITGFNFGEYPKNIGKKVSEKIVTSKKRCLLHERLFPNYTNSSVKIGDLKSFILNQPFLEVDDADAVRVCLNLDFWNIFAWGSYLCDFTYDGLEDTWNKINKYLSLPEHRQTLKYSVLGFTAPIRIWIYDMLLAVRACGFRHASNETMEWDKKLKWVDVNKIFSKIKKGQPPRRNMLPSDGEMTSCYYMSFQVYVYGERKSVPSPIRDHFRRQDESSSSISFSGRSHGRGRGSMSLRSENLESFEEPAVFQTKYDERVVQDEVMNKNNTTENNFRDIEDDKELEERNDNMGNKFDDDVFDINDYNEAKEVPEEDEVIVTGNVDYYDAYVAHDTKAKKKVDIKSTSPVPPPAFAVAHDFSVLRLQPYIAGGEVVIHNYLFHSYDVQHRLFNFVLDRDFWSALFGHAHDGWLESSKRRIGGRLWLVFLRTSTSWLLGGMSIDTVLLPIHSSPNHWLFGELRLTSMEVHIYDSLGRVAYEKFISDGTFTKFESRVENYLDKINYWARRNIPRIPLKMQFIYEENVPQQSSHLGDCGF
uniref:Ubiquitin-like protease family profile domain-containing protein n=1 Tax=Lactuca sativa TaxID=4236 RepID=A0A9R1UXK9_LACSA|nr:hypothetical protein LSAT_V11C700385420 [Lactuca sativa]